jgi:hypothetical protein
MAQIKNLTCLFKKRETWYYVYFQDGQALRVWGVFTNILDQYPTAIKIEEA